MPDSRIPLYLITGFLDSGKTTLLTDTLNMDYFNDGQRTVLLRCEDGEEEYDQQQLSQRNCRLVPIENQEALNTEFLNEVDRRYQPERVLLEFNGMWMCCESAGCPKPGDFTKPSMWWTAPPLRRI